MTDLNGAIPGVLIRRPHALGLLNGERHGSFLVDVLTGVERGHKLLRVQMLRRGDQNRVDACVFQQPPVLQVQFCGGHDRVGGLQSLRIDVRHGDAVGIRAGQSLTQQFGAPGPGPNDADTQAVVGAEHVGCGQCPGQARSYFADEISSRFHRKKARSGRKNDYYIQGSIEAGRRASASLRVQSSGGISSGEAWATPGASSGKMPSLT